MKKAATALVVGPGPEWISHPAFSPDGSSLAYVSWDWLHVRKLDTGTDERISPNDWTATTPIWSADGTELLWLTTGETCPAGQPALLAAPVDDPAAVRVIVGSGAVDGWSNFPALPTGRSRCRLTRCLRGHYERSAAGSSA